MVYLKKTSYQTGYDDSYRNQYWRLGSHLNLTVDDVKAKLQEGGFYVRKSELKDKTWDLYTRLQRQHLCYANCTVVELQAFVEARKLTLRGTGSRLKDRLARTLEEGDDQATFPRFCELPPELRNLIYGMYFSGFEIPQSPHQPPITLSSRLLRSETLALFYASCRFRFIFRQGQRSPDEPGTYAVRMMNDLLRNTGKEYFAQIRSLVIHHEMGTAYRRLLGARRTTWELDLNEDINQNSCVRKDPQAVTSKCPKYKEWINDVTSRLETVVEQIVGRSSDGKLWKSDIIAIRRVFESCKDQRRIT